MSHSNNEHIIFSKILKRLKVFSEEKWKFTYIIYFVVLFLFIIITWIFLWYYSPIIATIKQQPYDPNLNQNIIFQDKAPFGAHLSFVQCADLANSANAVLAIAFALFVYFIRNKIINRDECDKIIKDLPTNISQDVTAAKQRGELVNYTNQQLIAFIDLNVREFTKIADVSHILQGAISFLEFLVALFLVSTAIGFNIAAWYNSMLFWKIGFEANLLFILHLFLLFILGLHLSNTRRKTWDLRKHRIINYFKSYLVSCNALDDEPNAFEKMLSDNL